MTGADAVCKTCPVGRYNDDGNDKKGTDRLLHDNEDDCDTCMRGMYFVSAVDLCHVCAEGTYQPHLNVDGVKCVECPSAKYILDKAKNSVKHEDVNDCLGCPSGFECQKNLKKIKATCNSFYVRWLRFLRTFFR